VTELNKIWRAHNHNSIIMNL